MKKETKFYVIKNIKYDTDGQKIKLPKTLKITIPKDITGDEETEQYISDEISNITGFCHLGFDIIPPIK